MQDTDKLLVTIRAAHENLICTITQTLNTKYYSGHYKVAIMDLDGNIKSAFSTTGGAPKGIVDKDLGKQMINDYVRYEEKSQ